METSTQAFSTASLDDDIKDESDNDLKEPVDIDENSLSNIIEEICPVDGPCIKCKTEQPCSFRFTDNGEALYICNEPCIKAYQAEYPGKFTVTRKNYIIEEITPKTLLCSECKQKKACYFCHNFDGEDSYYCSLNCLDLMMADEKDKYAFKLSSVTICIDQIRPKGGQCLICEKVKPCEFSFVRYGEPCFLCERTCIKILSVREHGRYFIKSIKVSEPAVSNAIDKNLDEGYKIQAKAAAMVQREQSFHRRCSQCTLILMTDENVLTWEVMDFCDEICLGRFQNRIGSRCAKCNTLVQHTSLGKYCVRFGSDIRQFCNSSCLDQFKKGLKICYYCQGDISASTQEYLAPVGDKGQYKHFCSQSCVQKFDQFSKNPVPEPVWAKCAVCSLEKATTVEMEVTETASQRICSDPCFAAYKFVSNIIPDQCKWCKKYFERKQTKSFTTYDDANPNCFCSLSCMTIHIYHTRLIVSCSWCKSLKYTFDMIRKVNEQAVLMCSLHCLSLYQESANARSSSNGVPPPTLPPPVPSGEQGRADVMTVSSSQRSPSPSPDRGRSTSASAARRELIMGMIPQAPSTSRKRTRLSSVECREPARGRSVSPALSNSSASSARITRLLAVGQGISSDPQVESPPRKRIPALLVNKTPRGSLRVTGMMEVQSLPECRVLPEVQPPLCVHDNELLEALDMSDEEAQDVMAVDPDHVTRWLARGSGVAQEYSFRKPLTPSTVAVECFDGASGGVSVHDHDLNLSTAESMSNVCSAEHGVRPSTSGVTATPMPVTKSLVAYGSDLDSEFDDEFDEPSILTTAVEIGRSRDIPDDEELEENVREVITGIERAIDDEADRMNGTSSSFIWQEDFDTFGGIPEIFSGDSPGPIKDYDSTYDCFVEIWDKHIIERIVQETNRYAMQTIDNLKAKGELKPSSRLHQWVPTDADEIIVLFAVIMYMGIDARTSQNEYWRSDDFLEMPKFKKIMTYSRYVLLNKFLHFVDNDCLRNEEDISPKLAKLGPVIRHLNSKFSTLYNLAREISIDESLTLFKGRLSWFQAVRTKAARFGVKSFELCESRTGYMYKFQIYTGKNSASLTDVPSTDLGGKSTIVVLDLLKGLEHLGHCVTMDNYYNCPSLARYLKSLGFDCLGTLRTNRRHMPNDIAKLPKNVAKGSMIARHSGDVSVVAWKDSKLVTIISTYHNDDTYVGSRAGKALVKPVSVRDYNNTMGGVDLKDQKLSMYLLERKRGLKWYVKMFKRLLNVSIHNAFIMYVSSMMRQNKPSMTHREFRYSLAKDLVAKHRPCLPLVDQPVVGEMRLRRDVLHVPKYCTGTDKNSRRRCVICYRHNITKLVYLQCITCGVFMCFEACWIEWHSLANLKRRDTRGRTTMR